MKDAEYELLADKHFEQAQLWLAAPHWVEVREVNEPVLFGCPAGGWLIAVGRLPE
jgi:hypothetical protein